MYVLCSVPVVVLSVGLKLAELSPAKHPAESATTKLPRKNQNSDSQTPPTSLRDFCPAEL